MGKKCVKLFVHPALRHLGVVDVDVDVGVDVDIDIDVDMSTLGKQV